MSDYISRQAAIDAAKKLLDYYGTNDISKEYADHTAEQFMNRVPSAQPTADVVEVVRCKDCEYGQSYDMFGSRYCIKHNDVAVKDNDFCSHGERAEE